MDTSQRVSYLQDQLIQKRHQLEIDQLKLENAMLAGQVAKGDVTAESAQEALQLGELQYQEQQQDLDDFLDEFPINLVAQLNKYE